jgi:hypothetical protein
MKSFLVSGEKRDVILRFVSIVFQVSRHIYFHEPFKLNQQATIFFLLVSCGSHALGDGLDTARTIKLIDHSSIRSHATKARCPTLSRGKEEKNQASS